MVGEERVTAHGSAGGGLPARPAAGDVAGGVIDAVSVDVVACGVFATVESPEPQPVNVRATIATAAESINGSARQGSDHTGRTVPSSGRLVRQAGPRPARLC